MNSTTSQTNYRIDVGFNLIDSNGPATVPCGMNTIKYIGARAASSRTLIDIKNNLKPGQDMLLSQWHGQSLTGEYRVYGQFTAPQLN